MPCTVSEVPSPAGLTTPTVNWIVESSGTVTVAGHDTMGGAASATTFTAKLHATLSVPSKTSTSMLYEPMFAFAVSHVNAPAGESVAPAGNLGELHVSGSWSGSVAVSARFRICVNPMVCAAGQLGTGSRSKLSTVTWKTQLVVSPPAMAWNWMS